MKGLKFNLDFSFVQKKKKSCKTQIITSYITIQEEVPSELLVPKEVVHPKQASQQEHQSKLMPQRHMWKLQ